MRKRKNTIDVSKQLLDVLYIPTVLINNDGTPIEYLDHAKFRVKKRNIKKVPVSLVYFLLKNEGSLEDLESFSSGDFLRYLKMSSIFKS